MVFAEQGARLFRTVGGQRLRRPFEIRQAAPFCFGHPLLRVTVSVEQHPLVLPDNVGEDTLQRGIEILRARLFKLGADLVKRLGHDGVQYHIRGRGILLRTHGAELELVSGESKRRSPIAIRVAARKGGNGVHAQLDHAALVRTAGAALFDLINNVGELFPQKDRNDGGGRLVRAETVIVARRSHGGAQQVGVRVHGFNQRTDHGHELGVFVRIVAGTQPVLSVGTANGPVVVLAGTVHARKRFFVQEARETMLLAHAAEDLHRQHVVVHGQIQLLEHRRDFKLSGADLVVPGARGHAQPPEFAVEIGHERHHPALDRAKIVVLKLLVLGRRPAEQCSPALQKIQARLIKLLIDQEIFLLRPQRGDHPASVRLHAKQFRQPANLHIQRLHGAQQGRLLVQRFAMVSAEHRWDAQGAAFAVLLDKGRAGGIPRRITARLKSRPQTA